MTSDRVHTGLQHTRRPPTPIGVSRRRAEWPRCRWLAAAASMPPPAPLQRPWRMIDDGAQVHDSEGKPHVTVRTQVCCASRRCVARGARIGASQRPAFAGSESCQCREARASTARGLPYDRWFALSSAPKGQHLLQKAWQDALRAGSVVARTRPCSARTWLVAPIEAAWAAAPVVTHARAVGHAFGQRGRGGQHVARARLRSVARSRLTWLGESNERAGKTGTRERGRLDGSDSDAKCASSSSTWVTVTRLCRAPGAAGGAAMGGFKSSSSPIDF
jgi:hypothetical protein